MVEPLLLLFFFHFYLRVFTTSKIILETIQKIGQKLHFLFFENNVYEKNYLYRDEVPTLPIMAVDERPQTQTPMMKNTFV